MRRPRLILVVLACAAGVAAVVGTLALRGTAPIVPPLPDLTHVDPAVVQMLQTHHAAVVADPDQASRWLALALAYDANAMDVEALQCYDQAEGLGQDGAELPYHRAAVRERLGQIELAVTDLERAAERAPTYAPAQWRLGFLWLDLGELDAAEGAFRRAIKIDFNDAAGWVGLSRVLLEQGRAGEAIDVLDKVRPNAGSAGRYVWHLLSIAYRGMGRAEDAQRAAWRAAAVAPAWPDPWRDRLRPLNCSRKARLAQGKDLMEAGKADQAIELLTTLRAEWPDEPAVGTNLGSALMRAGRLPDSIRVLEETARSFPRFAMVHAALATSLLFQSLKPEPQPEGWSTAELRARALMHADQALALNPGFGIAHAVRAAVIQQAGDLTGALQGYEEALRCDGANVFWLRSVAEIQFNLGRFEDALATSQAVVGRDPQSGVGYLVMGLSQLRLGRAAEAEQSLVRANELTPRDPRIESALAQARLARRMGSAPGPS